KNGHKRLYDPSSPTLFLRGLIAWEVFVTLSDAYMLRKPLTWPPISRRLT
ncbi:hypothetical protein HYDPIDRAFT_110122, partial [Hydnomerulius pinastri MD-312]